MVDERFRCLYKVGVRGGVPGKEGSVGVEGTSGRGLKRTERVLCTRLNGALCTEVAGGSPGTM